MQSDTDIRMVLIIMPTATAIVSGVIGYSQDWVGWVFCGVFTVITALIIALMLYEQSVNFRASLKKINTLDLTYQRDLPEGRGRRLTFRDHLCTQFAWLARHRN